MARTPRKVTEPALMPALNEAEFAKDEAAVKLVASTQVAMDEVLAAGIDLGRLEALDFVLTVSTSAILAVYENVKKSKTWRLLRNPNSAHGEQFASLDQFCEVKLGKSYQRLRAITANRNLIGQEAFEQAERIGLHQRDYADIRALPAPDRELVRRAIEETHSRDEVIDLLQELAARHANEKAQLHKETQDLRDQSEDLAASKKDLEGKVTQLRKEAKRLERATPDEVAAHLRREIEKFTLEAEGMVTGPIRDGLEQLREHADSSGLTQNDWMAGQLSQVMRAIKHAAARLGIQLVESDTPAWAVDPSGDPNTAAAPAGTAA